MPFSERPDLKDTSNERRPLLRDPTALRYNHRYGRGMDPEMDDLLGLNGSRNQRFQWMVFLGVTFISILILMATMGVLIKLSQTHPAMPNKTPTTTTTIPFSTTMTSTVSTTVTTPNTTLSAVTTPTSPVVVPAQDESSSITPPAVPPPSSPSVQT